MPSSFSDSDNFCEYSFKLCAVDDTGNTGSNTTYVLVVPKYDKSDFGIKLYAINSPLDIYGDQVSTSPDFDGKFDLTSFRNGSEGVAFVVTSLRTVHTGHASVKIFDAVGNAVSDAIPFDWGKFKIIVDGNPEVVGVAMWNGRNINGRTVGAGAYVGVIEIYVESAPVEADSLKFPVGWDDDTIKTMVKPYTDGRNRTEFEAVFTKVVGVRKR